MLGHAQIVALVVEALPAGPPSLKQIADRRGVSSRTLQRQLAAQGTTFRGVVEDAQMDLASSLLAQSSLTITQIAFRVGFSEASAFSKAAKARWQETPTQRRKRLRTPKV